MLKKSIMKINQATNKLNNRSYKNWIKIGVQMFNIWNENFTRHILIANWRRKKRESVDFKTDKQKLYNLKNIHTERMVKKNK